MTFMPSTRSTDPSSRKGRLAASSLLICRVPLLMDCLSGGNGSMYCKLIVDNSWPWWVHMQMLHGCVKLAARRINRTIEVAKLQVLYYLRSGSDSRMDLNDSDISTP